MVSQKINNRATDLLAQRLYEAGCRFAFGMPGGEVLTIVDSMEKSGIKFQLCKHENSAGFMAEGAHHVNGAPAILVATIGPGLLNCVNVVANAFQEKVPLLVISGCVDDDEALTYTHQVVDHQAVMRPITKASFKLTANSADIVADKAVNIATHRRCGPVHIDVPISVADVITSSANTRRRSPIMPTMPVINAEMELAKTWLGNAKKPIMVVGLDVLYEDCASELTEFIERFHIPFITTYKAKGIIDEIHPLCLGGAGLSPLADKALLPLVEEADLIFCVGYDPVEMRTGWREIWNPDHKKVVDISAEPNLHYMHHSSLSIVSSIAPALKFLGTKVKPQETVWDNDAPNLAKKQLQAAFPKEQDWGPLAIIDECQKVLPINTRATVDSGAHRIVLSQMWKCRQPRSLLQSSAFCTMGCALPLALGAEYAEPDKTVVAFVGDAGFLMGVGELSTAAEIGSKAIFVVFVDGNLALIDLKQKQRELTSNGVEFAIHNIADIGRAFGGNGFTVKNRKELENALNAGLKSNKFTVIAAVLDKDAYIGRL